MAAIAASLLPIAGATSAAALIIAAMIQALQLPREERDRCLIQASVSSHLSLIIAIMITIK